MPYELRDLAPVMDYVQRYPEFCFALRRSLHRGRRPGFAAIVDRPDPVNALMLVQRPDWRRPGSLVTEIQLDAVSAPEALQMLSWIPPAAHVAIRTYRPWLQELVHSALEPRRCAQRVLIMTDRQRFRPGPHHDLAVEIGPDGVALRRQAEDAGVTLAGDRLFGVVQDGRLVAFAALAPPEQEHVAVRVVFTVPDERRRGYGTAVLSAATRAGLEVCDTVVCSLTAELLPAIHLIAQLGFSPVCREWTVEGHPRPTR